MNTGFPWGDRDPAGGYQVGDYVGLIYSDHEEYIFDNPTGIVTEIKTEAEGPNEEWGLEEGEVVQQVTVQVEATVGTDRLYLIKRGSDKEEKLA